MFNEGRQRCFPGFLFLICDFPELLRVHLEFSYHLDVGMRQMVLFPNIKPFTISLSC